MEFVMSTDLNTALPKVIGFNFEELKAELTARLDYYNSLVVTEDTIKEGKAERAKLSKLREAVEAKRKEVKLEYMAPYTDFESKVKELVAIIDAPIAAIDGQLKAFDDLRREDKRAEIRKAYETIVPAEIQAIVPLERIFDPTWLNATVKTKAVEAELTTMVQQTEDDLQVLDMVEPEFAAAVRARYMETLNIGAALRYKQTLVAAAEAAKRRSEAMAAPAAAPAQEPEPVQEEPDAHVVEPVQDEEPVKLYRLRLEIHLTQYQANALKRFLEENGIAYMKI